MRLEGPWLVLLVVAAFIAAGCVSDADDGRDDDETQPEGPTAPVAQSVEFNLPACDALEVFLYTSPDTVRPFVPDAFDVFVEAGQARAIIGVLVCGPTGNTTARGFVAIQVSPNDESLRADGVVNYFWEPEHTLDAASDTSRAFWSLGADAVEADVSVSLAAASTSARIETTNWTHTFDAPLGPGPAGEAANQLDRFREYAPADGGFVYLEAGFGGDAEAGLGGSAVTVETGPDTVAREVFGASATLAGVTLDDAEYTDARVGFVPWPPADS